MSYYPVDIEKAVIRECKRRRFSQATIKTYLYCINRFLKLTEKQIQYVSKKDVKEFLIKLSEKNLSGSSLNTYHMAIRFLFEQVLDKKIWIDIKYSKVPLKLPIVLNKEEVREILNKISNEKHRLMVALMYSAGLRVLELLNLKIIDLELDKNYGFVRKGKGNKDRIFIIADKIKEPIKLLIEIENLEKESYLFKSNRDKRYSVRTVQQIIKKAKKKAKIDKQISPHTFRHSFATHLIENNYSVLDVQGLLGHKSPETTFTYLHIASPNMINIKSPLDSF